MMMMDDDEDDDDDDVEADDDEKEEEEEEEVEEVWGHFSPPGPPESLEGQWDLAALAARRMPEPTFVVSFWVTEPPPSHQASHQQEMENGRKELLSLSPPNLGKR